MTIPTLEEMVEELYDEILNTHTRIAVTERDDKDMEQDAKAAIKSHLTTYAEVRVGEERERCAELVAMAGVGKVSLLNNEDNFTGTFWVSANDLYFYITGTHLNADFESGKLPWNGEMANLTIDHSPTDNPQHHD